MYFTVKKKTVPKEKGWFSKALRRVAKRTPIIQQFCSTNTEVRQVTVDKDGQVRDQFGRPVKCYDKEVSVGGGYVMIVPNNKYMRCLYFHSESTRGTKKDIRYHGPPPLVGAPPPVVQEPVRRTLEASPTGQGRSLQLMHPPSEQVPSSKKGDSDSISRQTTASTAC